MANRIVTTLFLILSIGTWQGARAQSMQGNIIDENNHPLPFTTIYVSGTFNGASSNEEGDYQLSLAPGKHKIVFQYVGYRREIREVEISTDGTMILNVQMFPEAYRLQEVVVNSKDKDPAYPVIREAIRKRKYHLNEVSAYTCRVYIKANQHIDKAPKRIYGFNIALDTGIIYLSESVSDLTYRHPGKFHERMISSKVSGSNKAFSFNMASEMVVNFYENLLEIEGLTERGFVSPIANNAFLYYDYRLIGTFKEGDYLINKIKVIPRRKGDPVFSGHIYIVEDLWRIHSLDLVLPKEEIEFIETLRVKQVYAPIDEVLWTMLSQRFDYRLNAFGVKGNGYFLGVYSNYKAEPRFAQMKKKEEAPTISLQPTPPKKANKRKEKQRPVPSKPHGKMSNEVLVIEKDANKRDEIYWDSIRPVPLIPREIKDYRMKDSLLVIKESRPYKDSIDRKINNLSLTKIFLTGYTHQQSYRRQYLSFTPIFSTLQYNTVEGIVTNLNVSYTKYKDDHRFYSLSPTVRYGFSSRQLYAKMSARWNFNPKKFSSGAVELGRFVSQFNSQEPIVPFINTYETIIAGRNLMKLFEKIFVSLNYRTELFNGLLISGRMHWEHRTALHNTSALTLVKPERRKFTPNVPLNSELPDTSFPSHQALITDLSLVYHPGQKYISRPDYKILLDNRWPAFTLTYRQGIRGVLASDVNFSQLSLKITDDVVTGLAGTAKLTGEVGFFPSRSTMYFMDYRHFNGNLTYLANYAEGNLQLLDYYRHSTRGGYFTGQYEHHFNGFIISKIPLLRRTKVQMVATANYLHTGSLAHYTELGVGLEHILKFIRADFFTSYTGNKHQTMGFRIGMGF